MQHAELSVTFHNPGCDQPLIIPIDLHCNSTDEAILENIRVNSRRPGKWVKREETHDRVAVICGSGPSLNADIAEILQKQREFCTVFALNGSARFLWENAIYPDYQVLLDARPETANLVGPAKQWLFASQCDPKCFQAAPDASLWHCAINGIDDVLPPYEDAYSLIGGAASVGITALNLAFVLGYRTFHLYGYDSSHTEGNGHAFDQPINDGDPGVWMRFNGKDYYTSLTMRMQVSRFPIFAQNLMNEGCEIHVHGSGLLPDMWNTPIDTISEVEKYRFMYDQPEYRAVSPGEHCVEEFLELVKPENGGTIIDFGCGTGRAGLVLRDAGFDVTLVDFAANCRDREAHRLPFVEADLTKPVPVYAAYGFCVDVLEHIPTDSVVSVIRNIMASAKTAYFQISTMPDIAGSLVGIASFGAQLHLTVQPHAWWRGVFESLGYSIAFERAEDAASIFVISRKD